MRFFPENLGHELLSHIISITVVNHTLKNTPQHLLYLSQYLTRLGGQAETDVGEVRIGHMPYLQELHIILFVEIEEWESGELVEEIESLEAASLSMVAARRDLGRPLKSLTFTDGDGKSLRGLPLEVC